MNDIPVSRNHLSAVDRGNLVEQSVGKTARWPRTDRRAARAEAVLKRRQTDFTVVLEHIADPFNVAAVLRSCDAVGIQTVHIVPDDEQPRTELYSRLASASASKWLEITVHDSIEQCFEQLRALNLSIWATALNDNSQSLHDLDFTLPTALVFGNEHRGVSPIAISMADGSLNIPMMGMVESLNISVACAVVLYEGLRQRTASGMYNESALTEQQFDATLADWLQR